MAEDGCLAGGLVDERGHDADQGGLAGAVGPEQREEIAHLDIQIDALQRLDAVLIGLGEAANRECIHAGRASGLRCRGFNASAGILTDGRQVAVCRNSSSEGPRGSSSDPSPSDNQRSRPPAFAAYSARSASCTARSWE